MRVSAPLRLSATVPPADALMAPAPEVWIDATRAAAGWRLWGMTLVERLARQAALRGAPRVRVWLSPESRAAAGHLRRDFARLYSTPVTFAEAPDAAAVRAALAQLQEPVAVLEGDAVYDDRVLDRLWEAGPGVSIRGDGVAALYLAPEHGRQLARVAGPWNALEEGLQLVPLDDIGEYVPELRLTMAPVVRRLTDSGQLRQVDGLLYRRTFKGVIDAVALYGYYHLVRWITRLLSRTRLAPNLFTVLSILAVWGAVPCFALGHLGWGTALAWAGVLLDSVDGKLARLTLHLSDAMGRVEHIAAMPGLGLWLLALGWHLTGGDLLQPSPMSVACWVLLGTFLADKATSGVFRSLVGRELFDYRPVDAAFHLVAARRNIHLPLGAARAAYLAMAAWMAATLAFHLVRFARVLLADGAARRPAA